MCDICGGAGCLRCCHNPDDHAPYVCHCLACDEFLHEEYAAMEMANSDERAKLSREGNKIMQAGKWSA